MDSDNLPIMSFSNIPDNDECAYYLLWLSQFRCIVCGIDESPLWRKCIGIFTNRRLVVKLCNACGIREKRMMTNSSSKSKSKRIKDTDKRKRRIRIVQKAFRESHLDKSEMTKESQIDKSEMTKESQIDKSEMTKESQIDKSEMTKESQIKSLLNLGIERVCSSNAGINPI
jgi:hypothetical protein